MNYGRKMGADPTGHFSDPTQMLNNDFGAQGNAYEQGRIETVLMVAEKPSIAKSIAGALSGGRYMTRRGKL